MSDDGGDINEVNPVYLEKPGTSPVFVTEVISDDERPGTKQPFLVESVTHTMRTQRWLGFLVVIAALGLHTLCVVAMIVGWINDQQFTLIERPFQHRTLWQPRSSVSTTDARKAARRVGVRRS